MADEQDLIERLEVEPDEPTLFDHFPFAHGQTDGSLAVVCACGATFHEKDRKAAKAAWAVHARGALAALRPQPQVTEDVFNNAIRQLNQALVFSAYRRADPLALRFEFKTEEARLAAANAMDQAFAALGDSHDR